MVGMAARAAGESVLRVEAHRLIAAPKEMAAMKVGAITGVRLVGTPTADLARPVISEPNEKAEPLIRFRRLHLEGVPGHDLLFCPEILARHSENSHPHEGQIPLQPRRCEPHNVRSFLSQSHGFALRRVGRRFVTM